MTRGVRSQQNRHHETYTIIEDIRSAWRDRFPGLRPKSYGRAESAHHHFEPGHFHNHFEPGYHDEQHLDIYLRHAQRG